MARYRRNGTPIGKHRVYAIDFSEAPAAVFELKGCETWDDADYFLASEESKDLFGQGRSMDRVVLVRPRGKYDYVPGGGLAYADMRNCVLVGADF